MARFKDDEDAGRFRFVRPEAGQCRITPVRKVYDLSGPAFVFPRFGGLKDVETAAVEKERMVTVYAAQLLECRMIFRKQET